MNWYVRTLWFSRPITNCFRKKSYSYTNIGAVAELDQKFIWLKVVFSGKTHDSWVGNISCFNIIHIFTKVFRTDNLYEDLQSGRNVASCLMTARIAYRNSCRSPTWGTGRQKHMSWTVEYFICLNSDIKIKAKFRSEVH